MRRLLVLFPAAGLAACSLLLGEGFSNGDRIIVADGAPVDAIDATAEAAQKEDGPTSGYRAVVLEDGPVAYWPLDETSGSIAHDASGNGNDGVLAPSGTWGAAGIPGSGGTALSLADQGGVTIGDKFDFPGRVPFSLEAWVRPAPAPANWRVIFDKIARDGQGKPSSGTYLWVNNDIEYAVKLERWVNGVGKQQAGMVPQKVPMDRFTHIVGTVNETGCAVFIDGVRVHGFDHNADIPDVSAPMLLGPNWVGELDELAIYDKELPAERVLAHYRAGIGQP
jgi:hypothetical protein